MSEEAERKRLAREASKLLKGIKTNLRSLSEEAGVSYGSLKVALSPKNAERSSMLPEYLEALSGALKRRSEEMRGVAEELRTLGKDSSSEEV